MNTFRVNVSLPVIVQMHCTTFVIDDKGTERQGHWYSATLFGRDLGLGAEVNNYTTRERAEHAAKAAVRGWVKKERERYL